MDDNPISVIRAITALQCYEIEAFISATDELSVLFLHHALSRIIKQNTRVRTDIKHQERSAQYTLVDVIQPLKLMTVFLANIAIDNKL